MEVVRVDQRTRIDLLIIAISEGIKLLAKAARGEEITDEDLELETFERTLERLKAERGLKNESC
jgi:hypothetical protein